MYLYILYHSQIYKHVNTFYLLIGYTSLTSTTGVDSSQCTRCSPEELYFGILEGCHGWGLPVPNISLEFKNNLSSHEINNGT